MGIRAAWIFSIEVNLKMALFSLEKDVYMRSHVCYHPDNMIPTQLLKTLLNGLGVDGRTFPTLQ